MVGTQTTSTSPPHTHQMEDDLFDRLRLLRSRRVGIATYRRLIAEHGTAKGALAALPDVAAQAGVKDYQICPESVIRAELKAGKRAGAKIISDQDPRYPIALHDLPDTPPFLWALGDTSTMAKPAIALVGARNASSLGTRMAKKLAGALGEAGFIVVSGLARGVDAAAHHAALSTGTVAVQAGGVDVIYPTENTNLAIDIAAKGLRLAEMPMGQQPQARHFPARNRIIAGLAQAVVVVEAAAKSGSLITARDALDLGREVFAVPGHPLDGRAGGCNILIRDGAMLTRSVDDILEALPQMGAPKQTELPLAPAPPPKRKLPNHPVKLHQAILDRIGPSPLAEEDLLQDLSVPAAEAVPVLTELELEGVIFRDAGGLLSRPC